MQDTKTPSKKGAPHVMNRTGGDNGTHEVDTIETDRGANIKVGQVSETLDMNN